MPYTAHFYFLKLLHLQDFLSPPCILYAIFPCEAMKKNLLGILELYLVINAIMRGQFELILWYTDKVFKSNIENVYYFLTFSVYAVDILLKWN
jgi:hypothetical protein